MSKRPSFKDFMENALKNAEFKAEYEALSPEFELIRQFIKARQKAHIFHNDHAKKSN